MAQYIISCVVPSLMEFFPTPIHSGILYVSMYLFMHVCLSPAEFTTLTEYDVDCTTMLFIFLSHYILLFFSVSDWKRLLMGYAAIEACYGNDQIQYNANPSVSCSHAHLISCSCACSNFLLNRLLVFMHTLLT